MASSSHGDQPEPTIKHEAPALWELPREIDLVSDEGSPDEISGNKPGPTADPTADTVQSTSTKPTKRSENKQFQPSAELLALQRRLADKYRTRKQQKSPEPEFEEDEPPYESDDEAKDAAFEQAKKEYNKKLRANKIGFEDEIAFMQLELDFSARKRKREVDEEFDRATTSPEDDEGEGLFIPDNSGLKFPGADSDDETPRPHKRSKASRLDNEKPKKARGRSKKVLGHDYTDDDVTKIIREARRERQSVTKSKAKAPAKTKTKPAAKSKGKGKQGTQLTNLNHLFGGDVFRDAAANTAFRSQPTFHNATRRDDAMKKLIASVPQESVHVSRADTKHLDKAVRQFTGQGSVSPASDGNWAVKGMRTTLKHFQVLGTGFMRARETQTEEPRGGILADEMGLGKTIMQLANIVNGRPVSKTAAKTTLVVASPALISQWFNEIRAHCYTSRETKHGLGKVMMYKSGNRIKSNDDAAFLEAADVLLTTYHEVRKSYPKAIVPVEKVTSKQKEDWWREFYEQNKGLLHSIKFLRVVLDEAQAIKNRHSHTSLACLGLQAKHRWCITGTPLLNSIAEMYPYLAFLRDPSTGSYKIFKENFCSPNDPDGKDKLGVLLRRVMIRRGHMDKMFDAKLVDLPPPSETTIWLELNDVERAIYEIVKTRFIEHINSISKKGQLQKSYSHIWVLILRLRQICAHALMIGQTCLDLLEREDYERLNSLSSEDKVTDEGVDLLLYLRQVLRDSVDVKEVDSTSSVVQHESEAYATGLVDVYGNEEDVGNVFGLDFKFKKYLDDYKHSEYFEKMVARTTCCGCRQMPSDPYMTSCLHVYCHDCLLELGHHAAKRGYDQSTCRECGTAYTSSKPLQDMPGKPLSVSSTDSDENVGRKKGKKDATMNWIDAPGPVLPSAKSIAVKAAILNFFQEDPKAKIIVYTQWLAMVRILERVCKSEGWACRKYTGSMSLESKDRAVDEFSNSDDINILIAGLKCGGLGLNLTAASKVLLVDPWWNKAIESQAFCRVYRIGQDKTTSLTRFVCRNTIDEAMMLVKEKKQVEIDELMNNSKLRENLKVEDLMRLFGKVEEDEEGRPFIFADAQSDGGTNIPRADVDDDNEFGFMNTDE